MKRHPARVGRESATGACPSSSTAQSTFTTPWLTPSTTGPRAERGARGPDDPGRPPCSGRQTSSASFVIRRTAVRPFQREAVELVKTFADQAVIAIENVRLFTELQVKNQGSHRGPRPGDRGARAADRHERDPAGDTHSPTDLQPVMDVVAVSAARFCGATDASIWRLEGESLRLVAVHGTQPTTTSIGGTIAVTPGSVTGRVVLDRQTIHVEDIQASDTEFPETLERVRLLHVPTPDAAGHPAATRRIYLSGSLACGGGESRFFTAKQIDCSRPLPTRPSLPSKTSGCSNNETNEALEQQTATSEILRVIASSPTDLQPVMEAVAGERGPPLRGQQRRRGID